MAIFCDIKKKLGNFTLQVSFDIKEETVALMGASGCGKSMTLRCIAGIMKPDSGKIIINGLTVYDSEKKIDLPPQKRRVGYMFQDYALFPNMTVEQNILSVLGKNRRDELTEYAKSYHLTNLLKHYPKQLSGGQKQRCALARMMAAEPEIILLDEPFSALDSYLRWQMEQEITAVLKQTQRSVLFVSHDRDEVFRVSDRVVIIHKGISEAIAEKHKLYRQPVTYVDALLTGCKNICGAEIKDGMLIAKDFGITLNYQKEDMQETEKNIRYIGIRSNHIQPAHQYDSDAPAFVSAYSVEQMIENVFTCVLMVRLPGSETALRWEMQKDDYEDLSFHDSRLAIPYEYIYLLQE